MVPAAREEAAHRRNVRDGRAWRLHRGRGRRTGRRHLAPPADRGSPAGRTAPRPPPVVGWIQPQAASGRCTTGQTLARSSFLLGFLTRCAIVPSMVGVNLGCSMVAVETQRVASDLPDTLAGVRSAIEKAVLHGNGPGGNWRDGRWPHAAESHYAPLAPDLAALRDADDELQRATEGGNEPVSQLGTLGGGNHFIEVCLDERDHVWIMLHSGSRGIGNRIDAFYRAGSQARRAGRHHAPAPRSRLAPGGHARV